MGSINNITKIRERILGSLMEFFSNRDDYVFSSNESKLDGQIYIYDEYADNIESPDTYPRLCLIRNGSRYENISGFNDTHIGHEHMNLEYQRSDVLNHNFTLSIKAVQFHPCEEIAYLASAFIRFFSKEIAAGDKDRLLYNVSHNSLSNVFKVGSEGEKRSVFQCDIHFTVEDNEIMKFEEADNGKSFQGIDFTFNIEEANC